MKTVRTLLQSLQAGGLLSGHRRPAPVTSFPVFSIPVASAAIGIRLKRFVQSPIRPGRQQPEKELSCPILST